jgi:phosphate starvation-inducible PhoH-like protein
MGRKKKNASYTNNTSTETIFHFEPKNQSQQEVVKNYANKDLLFLIGPAGNGKTHCALACAIKDCLAGNKETILVVRPAIETGGETLGHLPGSVEEKMDPYFSPIKRLLKRMVFKFPEEALLFQPLAYMRGDTFENTVLFLDEAQNASYSQLKMFLTRMGSNSKVIISGDPDQTDVKPKNPDKMSCDILSVAKRLSGLPEVAVVDFSKEESLRHPLIKTMLSRL